MYIVD